MTKVIDFARTQLKLSQIVGRYVKENPASGNVISIVGFKWEFEIFLMKGMMICLILGG